MIFWKQATRITTVVIYQLQTDFDFFLCETACFGGGPIATNPRSDDPEEIKEKPQKLQNFGNFLEFEIFSMIRWVYNLHLLRIF